MENNDYTPQKVIIVAGPSFGSAVSFMLLGAAIGAAGTLFWKSQQSSGTITPAEIKAEAESARLTQRATKLAKRVVKLARYAKDAAETVGVVVAPMVRSAIEEGKKVAHITTEEIKEEIDKRKEAATEPEPPISQDQA